MKPYEAILHKPHLWPPASHHTPLHLQLAHGVSTIAMHKPPGRNLRCVYFLSAMPVCFITIHLCNETTHKVLIQAWVPGHVKYRIWATFGSQPVPAHRATRTLRDRRQSPSSSEYIFLEEMLVVWTAGHGWWSVICATLCNTHRAYYQIPICPENQWNMSTSKVLCNPSHVATMGPLPFTDFRLWSQAWGRVHHGGLI